MGEGCLQCRCGESDCDSAKLERLRTEVKRLGGVVRVLEEDLAEQHAAGYPQRQDKRLYKARAEKAETENGERCKFEVTGLDSFSVRVQATNGAWYEVRLATCLFGVSQDGWGPDGVPVFQVKAKTAMDVRALEEDGDEVKESG
jgi:hypothetical protein